MYVCRKKKDKWEADKLEKEMICPRCGSEKQVYVHGHTQCGFCHLVVEECCSGEVCEVAPPLPSGTAECTCGNNGECQC